MSDICRSNNANNSTQPLQKELSTSPIAPQAQPSSSMAALVASRRTLAQMSPPPRRSRRVASKGNGLALPPGFPMSSSYPPTQSLPEREREREREREEKKREKERKRERQKVRERDSSEQIGKQTAKRGSQLPQTGTAVDRRSGQLRAIQPPAVTSCESANLTPGHRHGAASGTVGRVSGSDSVLGSYLSSSAVTGAPRAAVSIPGMGRTVAPATARQTASSCRSGSSPSTGSARCND